MSFRLELKQIFIFDNNIIIIIILYNISVENSIVRNRKSGLFLEKTIVRRGENVKKALTRQMYYDKITVCDKGH